jgi:hypothetical protein
MNRDEIMHLVNACAPRYESWGCEAHFQAFAKRLMAIEREACADLCVAERSDSTKDLAERPSSTKWCDWMRFEFEVTEWQAKMIQKHVEQRVAAEREACAKICDESQGFRGCFCCSLDIRARGEQ